MSDPVDLWHYTCSHSLPGIMRSRMVYPAVKLLKANQGHSAVKQAALAATMRTNLQGQVVWLADLPHIIPLNRNKIGLSSGTLIDCDRTEHRFRMLPQAVRIVPWSTLRERWPLELIQALEALPGAEPDHWFASAAPVRVTYAPHHEPTQARRAIP